MEWDRRSQKKRDSKDSKTLSLTKKEVDTEIHQQQEIHIDPNRSQITAAQVETYPMKMYAPSLTRDSSRSASPEATWSTLPRHINSSAPEADRGRVHLDGLNSVNSGKHILHLF